MKQWVSFAKDTALFLSSKGKRFRWTLPLSSRSYFVLLDRPGIWATDKELKEMVADLRQISEECQGDKGLPLYGVLLGDREDLKDRVISIAYSKQGQPLGFSAQKYLELKEDEFKMTILHLGLIFISPKTQGKNISYLLGVLPNILLSLKVGLRPIWVSNVSQVPAVVGLVAKNFTNVFPNVDGSIQSFHHRRYSSLIARDHRFSFGVGEDATWSPDRQVLMNAYTGGSDNLKKNFESSPKHRDEKINELCQRELDYARGDDFVQLGVLSTTAFLALFKNKRAKQNIIQLTFNIALFSFLGALLPAIRWLISNDEFSASSSNGRKKLIFRGSAT